MIIKILEEIHVDKTVVLLIIEAEHSHTVTAIISPRKLICRTPGMNMTPFDTMIDLLSQDFLRSYRQKRFSFRCRNHRLQGKKIFSSC